MYQSCIQISSISLYNVYSIDVIFFPVIRLIYLFSALLTNPVFSYNVILQKKANVPFKRVDESKVLINDKFKDNSFEAKV